MIVSVLCVGVGAAEPENSPRANIVVSINEKNGFVDVEIAVKNEIGCKVRSVELNLPQRCAAHLASKTDLDESVMLGKAAVSAAEEGITRQMMTMQRVSDKPYSIEYWHSDVSEIANKIRTVDDAFINEAGNHVTDACCRYLLPLIAGEAACKYESGLPVHLIL